MAAQPHEMKQLLGVALRCDPARESCYRVVQLPHELHEYPPGSEHWRRESLHRHFNTEVQSMEIAAQSLADFGDAPWELRLAHARQCWDEARHAQLIARQLKSLGGRLGEFPIVNFDWGVACAVDTLAGRLAVQNRTVEAGEMDLLQALRDAWRSAEYPETALIMDGILADEIQHVRFANRWLKCESRRNPRILLQVAAAISYIRSVTRAFEPKAGTRNGAGVDMDSLDREGFALNLGDRRLAEFSEADLESLQDANSHSAAAQAISHARAS